MNLPQNLFDGNVSVQVFLCQPDKKIIGEILPYDFNATFKFNTYSEISFTIDRYYNDLFEGKTKVHPLYDLIESLRIIYIRGVGHFIIQDVDEGLKENDSKSITCFSLEYATGQKYLENFYVNTGEEGSIETMYNAKLYGVDYNPNNDPYSAINVESDIFDPYQRYYIKQYDKDGKSWNAEEKQVLDENHFKTFVGENSETTLYIRNYERVRFYWPTKPELSLLHHVFDLIPEWKIGHVDKELWYQERTFSEDRTAVYDFLYNTAADTLSFVMVWDSINGVCNFYKTEEDGVTTNTYIRTNTYNPNFVYYSDINGTIAEEQPKDEEDVINGVFYINVGSDIETQWNTDVFISRDNLASELDIKYSTDDIKTKLKIGGSDDLDVRDVNLGQNYILNLSYYNTPLWMGEDLHSKYNAYTNQLAKYTIQYKEFVSAWSAAYNEYNDLVNYVPVEPRVMLIGDVFEKLYCVKNPYLPAPKKFDDEVVYDTYYKYNSETLEYYEVSTPTAEQLKNGQYYVKSSSSMDALVKQLRTKLNLYDVDKDGNGKMSAMARTDDVLLTLENAESNSATVRVRYNQDIKGLGYCKTVVTNDDIINQTKFTLYTDSTSNTVMNTTNVKELANGDLYVASNYVFEYRSSANAFIATNKPVYLVYRTLTNATTGISNTLSYTLQEWINGELLANKMGLDDGNESRDNTWKIKSIGTLGAYFCLVRDETNKTELEDYGIRLLQEKQDTYTKIFITQTEGYMNEEGSQCVTSGEPPIGDEYPVGTKWLDTNNTKIDGSLIMMERTNNGWVDYIPDDNDYENYARFYENYVKLGNVQSVLAEKQIQADYLLNGVPVNALYLTGDNINLNNLLRAAVMHFIVLDNDWYITRLGEELPNEDIVEGAVWFFINDVALTTTIYQYVTNIETGKKEWVEFTPSINITLQDYDENFFVLTFTVDTDSSNEYAVYVIDGTPYVSYARSQGVYLAKMNIIKEATDINNNFTEQELVRLSPFIREDEFSDDNFLLTGYESEEEQMHIKQELLKAGEEELKKICQPKLSFSATMANILAIPEFAPIKNQFQLGNFVKVGIREGYVKRARLLEVQMNFDDPSDFSTTFGDLISTRSEIDKHAELLEQAVTAGKSVAANKSSWQRGADKANALDQAINEGLRNAALSVGAADGQSIIWDKYGIRGRKLRDGSTDEYEPQQFALINNKLVFTDDNWQTSRAVVGEFEIELPNDNNVMVKQNMYGLLADAIVGGYIQGTDIVGGSLKIGDGSNNYFQVDEKGDVKIVQAGQEKYATTNALESIKKAYKYSVRLEYEGSTIITGNETSGTTIRALVYDDGKDITASLDASIFNWKRSSGATSVGDEEWNNAHKGLKTIEVTHNDVYNSTHFWCEVDI